ncbi:spinocerebellar ataxia type 10 protein domain-containing protein [Gigaspora rosea]|uniref:Ataxin-10 homolog n=1 Tax=Gigaspora rosea TaxID=44941 RepID=A0A397VBC2_9GLOM|nr:spinocerebellar ataxia type 10 protein domain-containing protein [Gigaspora rosea]
MEFERSNQLVQQLESIDPLKDADNLVHFLKQIATEAQANSKFREVLGQNPKFWISITKICSLTTEKLIIGEIIVIPILLWLVRTFRNIVATVTENQNKALEQEWNKMIEKILWYCLLQPESDVTIIRSGIQALSNLITGNNFTQEFVWSDFMNRNEFDDLLSKLAGHNDNTILTGCLVFIHNCIFESESRRKSLVTSDSGTRILQRLLDRAETLLEDESTQNFELIYAIFARIIESDLYPLLFDSLNLSSSGQSLTRRQIILLKLLDSKLFSSDSIDISLSTCIYLLQIFDTICPQVISSMQQVDIVDRENQPQEIEDTSILYTGLVLLLQCFGKLSQDENDKIRECLFKGGIIASCISLLVQADKTFPRVTKAMSSPLQQGISEFAYIKRDIIKVIGNMAYNNSFVQDEVRRLGGIPLILNQCNIDDNNPYIREHAIFALRNLLINNSENQKLVKELEPIAPVQTDVLSEIGIKAQLENGGKIKLTTDSNKM